ncbi:heme-binding domain-containing protein [Robiginitalea sp. IMCC43444]|uniref:heme-binding domain-containing protein n=1 Tax=Robiginitalea sp. IMCC43444 TaxID=3459121 RepID=UPI004040EFBA
MKVPKKIAILLLLFLLGIQFVRPEKNIDHSDHLIPFFTETNPPENVKLIMKSNCFDCHSNHSEYPWYNNIAPVSYWLAEHINNGKQHLNFSAWNSYDAKKKDHKLEEVAETIESGEMPLNEYTWTHAGARLTEAQRKAVIEWAEATRVLYRLNALPE